MKLKTSIIKLVFDAINNVGYIKVQLLIWRWPNCKDNGNDE